MGKDVVSSENKSESKFNFCLISSGLRPIYVSRCTWMKMQEAGMVLEEQPIKVAEAIRSLSYCHLS